MSEKHFRMELTPVDKPKGMATASFRNCIACGDMLTSMGGGGNYLCGVCYHTLYSRKLQMKFREIKHNQGEE